MPVRLGATLELGTPRVLFTAPGTWGDFDVTADGRRILAMEVRKRAGQLPLTVVSDWPHSLRR